jgi:hypothetical protein
MDTDSDGPVDETLSISPSWSSLSPQERSEYLDLKYHFHHDLAPNEKDRNLRHFRKDVHSILDFINSTTGNREHRAIVCGLAAHGRFLCIHQSQLKQFMGRCKSSINGSFRRLGFSQLDVKRDSLSNLVAALPSLEYEPSAQKQWSVRQRLGAEGESAADAFAPPFLGELPKRQPRSSEPPPFVFSVGSPPIEIPEQRSAQPVRPGTTLWNPSWAGQNAEIFDDD